MNWTLFKSIHFVIAAAICAACIGWMVATHASPGARAGSNGTLVLWTGWLAFGFMLTACLYSARKYMHWLGYSPEFKRRVSQVALERTESKLNEIRRKVTLGHIRTEAEVLDLARRAVREENVGAVLVVKVGRDQKGQIKLTSTSPEPLGRMVRWLHAHVYYGFFSGVLVWVHGGGICESPLGLAMNALTLIVILTGVLGILLFALGPTWITRNEKEDMNFEDVYVLGSSLDAKIEEVSKKFDAGSALAGHVSRARAAGGARVDAEIRKELDHALATEEGQKNKALLEDVMVLIGQRTQMRTVMSRLSRIRLIINAWRVVHVPLSILLMAIVVVHVFSVWIY